MKCRVTQQHTLSIAVRLRAAHLVLERCGQIARITLIRVLNDDLPVNTFVGFGSTTDVTSGVRDARAGCRQECCKRSRGLGRAVLYVRTVRHVLKVQKSPVGKTCQEIQEMHIVKDRLHAASLVRSRSSSPPKEEDEEAKEDNKAKKDKEEEELPTSCGNLCLLRS